MNHQNNYYFNVHLLLNVSFLPLYVSIIHIRNSIEMMSFFKKNNNKYLIVII